MHCNFNRRQLLSERFTLRMIEEWLYFVKKVTFGSVWHLAKVNKNSFQNLAKILIRYFFHGDR